MTTFTMHQILYLIFLPILIQINSSPEWSYYQFLSQEGLEKAEDDMARDSMEVELMEGRPSMVYEAPKRS